MNAAELTKLAADIARQVEYTKAMTTQLTLRTIPTEVDQ